MALTESEKRIADAMGPMVAEQVLAGLTEMRQNDPKPPTALTLEEISAALKTEVLQLAQTLEADLTHHLCLEQACKVCPGAVKKIRKETLSEIEERLPGTIEGLKNYEILSTPVAAAAV